MRKTIKKWGDSLVISFTKEETQMYELGEGDVLDIDDILLKKINKGKRKI